MAWVRVSRPDSIVVNMLIHRKSYIGFVYDGTSHSYRHLYMVLLGVLGQGFRESINYSDSGGTRESSDVAF